VQVSGECSLLTGNPSRGFPMIFGSERRRGPNGGKGNWGTIEKSRGGIALQATKTGGGS